MAGIEVKNVNSPDEVRPFAGNGHANVLQIGGHPVLYGTFEPGWRWSENLKPIAGTDSCQVHHNGYIVSGRMGIRMDDGQEMEFGPGDVFIAPPGHDGWVIGNEACVALDFSGGAAIYAKK